MSLFKCTDFWSKQLLDDDYTVNSLCVANITLGGDQTDKIVVGSLKGSLSVFQPTSEKLEDASANDTFLETTLKEPIIQIITGRFLNVKTSNHLAILHPRRLAIYTIAKLDQVSDQGYQYKLSQLYEHKLQRISYNMCKGPFGGVKDRDYIAVQSVDCTISIFEQDSYAFSRFLPNSLIPGPICYIPTTDSFITVSSSCCVESYSLRSIGVSADVKTREDADRLKESSKVQSDWSYEIGEYALDIAAVHHFKSAGRCAILVLSERSIVCLQDDGNVVFLKKLDYTPLCLGVTLHGNQTTVSNADEIGFMIGSQSSSLLFYRNSTLVWGSHMSSLPIAVGKANFKSIQGAVVSLSSTGKLAFWFLGTEPSLFSVPQYGAREVDWATYELDMKRLKQKIKEKTLTKGERFLDTKSADSLQLRVKVVQGVKGAATSSADVNSALDYKFFHDNRHNFTPGVADSAPNGAIPALRLRVELVTRSPVDAVQLFVQPPTPLSAEPSSHRALYMDHTSSEAFDCHIFVNQTDCPPSDSSVRFTATYVERVEDGDGQQTASVAHKVLAQNVDVPFRLLWMMDQPTRSGEFKFTIETNKPIASLSELFRDVCADDATQMGANGPHMLGLRFYGGRDSRGQATLLASDKSERYRVQADSLGACFMPVRELVARLVAKYNSTAASSGGGAGAKPLGATSGIRISFGEEMPVEPLCEQIKQHVKCRLEYARLQATLEAKSAELRAVQKRLLVKYKDKTPASMDSFDALMELTYEQIVDLTETVEECAGEERRLAGCLAAAVRTFCMLTALWRGLSSEEFRLLQTYLWVDALGSGVAQSSALSFSHKADGGGWEETADEALLHLIRVLSHGVHESVASQAGSAAKLTENMSDKIRKHLLMLLSKLQGGARLPGVAKSNVSAAFQADASVKASPRATMFAGDASGADADDSSFNSLLNGSGSGGADVARLGHTKTKTTTAAYSRAGDVQQSASGFDLSKSNVSLGEFDTMRPKKDIYDDIVEEDESSYSQTNNSSIGGYDQNNYSTSLDLPKSNGLSVTPKTTSNSKPEESVPDLDDM